MRDLVSVCQRCSLSLRRALAQTLRLAFALKFHSHTQGGTAPRPTAIAGAWSFRCRIAASLGDVRTERWFPGTEQSETPRRSAELAVACVGTKPGAGFSAAPRPQSP